jgi:hypothetical protein
MWLAFKLPERKVIINVSSMNSMLICFMRKQHILLLWSQHTYVTISWSSALLAILKRNCLPDINLHMPLRLVTIILYALILHISKKPLQLIYKSWPTLSSNEGANQYKFRQEKLVHLVICFRTNLAKQRNMSHILILPCIVPLQWSTKNVSMQRNIFNTFKF